MAKPHSDPVIEALHQMTLYASALRRVICDEGCSSMLCLARARAGIGDPVDAIDDAQSVLSKHGVEVNLNGR